ncbi:MAG: antibiotic ABC transporter ATP-binding protein [Planctomycetes bacterium]|nr:antibiotic ABC transporter ATP-binding protein [Planctomycetota bacterium]
MSESADERKGPAVDPRILRRLWPFLRPHQRWVWLGFSCLMLGLGCRLAGPFLVKIAIDDHLAAGEPDGYGWIVGAFLALAVIEALLRRVQQVAVDTGGQSALLDLRLAIFRHLQRLSTRYFDRTPTGKLIGRVTTDVEALNEMFSTGVVTILGDLVFLVATLAILFGLDWQLTLVTLTVVPVLLAITMFIRIRVRSAYVTMRSKLSEMNAYLHEQVNGMPVVQMFNRQQATRDGYGEINAGVRGAQLGTVYWETLLSTFVELLSSFTVALILWYGGGEVAASMGATPSPGERALTLGVLFAFVDYMQKFFQPLNELSLKYTVLQNAMTASRRIFSLLDEDDVLPVPATPHRPDEVRGQISFEQVGFAYKEGTPVLHEIDFQVAPGERVALVGATGAGKSTVLKLLTRLYDVSAGRITLDGVDLHDFDPKALRQRVGMVPQDVFLFEGTILDNIRLGKPEVSDADAIAAATRLHLDRLVERFPGGWNEPVRERGRNLSAGEKQLISFARVLAAAPEVLVLDEATSNVDSHTEHLLQEAVHEVMQGRTSIAIAHRLSTVRDVDRILVFQKGRIVEQGSHEQLMAAAGVYADLVKLQEGLVDTG